MLESIFSEFNSTNEIDLLGIFLRKFGLSCEHLLNEDDLLRYRISLMLRTFNKNNIIKH